ncbi:MAG: DUF222 domain-containing protein [Microthrixaceae bacterium]
MFDHTGGPGQQEEGERPAAVATRAGLADWTDDGLIAALEQVESTRRSLDATAAHLAHELDRRRTTMTRDGLRTPGWIAWRFGLPRSDAGALVRMGEFLAGHDVIERALVDGTISAAHVRLLARACTPRVADVVQLIQEQLVDLARGARFETWARDVRALLDLADADGGHEPRPQDNHLSVVSDADGGVLVHGELVGEWAAEFRAALDAQADRLHRTMIRDAVRTDGEAATVPRPQLLALALVELVRQGRAAGRTGQAPVSDVTVVLTTPPTLPDACRAPAPGQSDAEWLERITAMALSAHTLDGHPIHPSTAGLLCCDAAHRVLVESFTGETLALGRSQRLASAAQRRAAAVRYGGCCFPGCDAPPNWVELHHTPAWDDGGRTDQDHLAPLCRHHHGIIHRAGWGLDPDANHGFVITTPSGRVLPVQRRGRARPPDELRSRAPSQRSRAGTSARPRP